VDDVEGEDGGKGDTDDPHADKADPEGADGVAGTLHCGDENHAVAEEDFGAGDIAEVVGGLGCDGGLVGEESVGEGTGEDENE